MNTTKLLLKHGVQSLLEENDDFFKQNISQALAIKLNETVNESKNMVSERLLENSSKTQNTAELHEFIKFVNDFDRGIYTFKDGTNINITESEIKELKNLFESLNPKNRQKMVSDIFNDGETFKNHIRFAQKVNKLL